MIAFVIIVVLGKTAQRLGDIRSDRRLFSDDQCFAHAIFECSNATPHCDNLCFPYRLTRKLLKLSSKSKTSGQFTSFPDAKLAENRIQQILGGGLAHDFSDGIDGDSQICRDQIQGQVGLQALECLLGGRPRSLQCLLMA